MKVYEQAKDAHMLEYGYMKFSTHPNKIASSYAFIEMQWDTGKDSPSRDPFSSAHFNYDYHFRHVQGADRIQLDEYDFE